MVKKKKKIVFKYSKFKSLIAYFKSKRKSMNYHIEVIFAQIGSGKTTDIAKRCFNEIYKYKNYSYVYTNVSNNIPGVRVFDVEAFKSGKYVFPPNSLILVDEVSLFFDNRNWKSFPHCVAEYLRLTRHFKNTFIFYSQHYDCEKTIRTLASKLWLMRKFGDFSVKRRITKIIKVNDFNNSNGAESQVMDSLKFDSIFNGGMELTYIPFYTGLFDSYAIDPQYSVDNIPYHLIKVD